MACPYSIGDFIWTGWDYLGETGIGAFCYDSIGTKDKDYPFLLAGCGVIDILGQPRPEVWLNKAVYGLTDAPYLGVEPVTHGDENRIIIAWRYSGAVHSWSWEGCEGKKSEIIVYCLASWVKLFQDDVSLGRKQPKECQASYETIYAPGTLTAVSYDEAGNELGRNTLFSAKGKTCLRLTADKKILTADGQNLCYVGIDLVGEDGVVKASGDREITVTIEGAGTLAGFDSAAPCTEERYTDAVHTSYYGRAMAVIRVATECGDVRMTVRANGCEDQSITL